MRIAGRYRIPDLRFPTNLLPLTPAKAAAIVEAGGTTVAASIDGTTQETYERIRTGGRSPAGPAGERRQQDRRRRVLPSWRSHDRMGGPGLAAAAGGPYPLRQPTEDMHRSHS